MVEADGYQYLPHSRVQYIFEVRMTKINTVIDTEQNCPTPKQIIKIATIYQMLYTCHTLF